MPIDTPKTRCRSGGQLVGLRLPPALHEEAQRLAESEGRTVANFALRMYLRGLAEYKQEQAIS